MGSNEEPNLASKLTSEASGTRDQANGFDGVFPDWTNILFTGGGTLHTFSSPFHDFEKDAVRLNHFSGNGVRERVIRSVSELEESVRLVRLSKGSFESLLAAECSECFRN